MFLWIKQFNALSALKSLFQLCLAFQLHTALLNIDSLSYNVSPAQLVYKTSTCQVCTIVISTTMIRKFLANILNLFPIFTFNHDLLTVFTWTLSFNVCSCCILQAVKSVNNKTADRCKGRLEKITVGQLINSQVCMEPRVLHRTYNKAILEPKQCQINPIHILIYSIFSIHFKLPA
jgi:hypothetical protein